MPAVLIEKMTLKNFRGFADLTLEGMRRLNLIVGNNGSGKTALMEGLSLAAGSSPHTAVLLRRFRGLPMLGGAVPHLLTFFDDLFYRFDTKTPAEIMLKGQRDGKTFSRGLTIGQESTGRITIPLNATGDENPAQFVDIYKSPVSFEWCHQGENAEAERFKTTPQITQMELQIEVGKIAFPLIFFPARGFFEATMVAEYFSHLDRENEAAKFVETMQRIFPDIEAISVAYEQNVGQLWVKARGLDKKASISLLSDGVSRVSEILLGTAYNRGGVALIDEVENGIHFERYGEVIEAIDEFSSTFGTQVFFTTHSDAMLDAFHENVAAKTEDFSIIRCSREENGGTNASLINDIWAKRALESGIELRA